MVGGSCEYAVGLVTTECKPPERLQVYWTRGTMGMYGKNIGPMGYGKWRVRWKMEDGGHERAHAHAQIALKPKQHHRLHTSPLEVSLSFGLSFR